MDLRNHKWFCLVLMFIFVIISFPIRAARPYPSIFSTLSFEQIMNIDLLVKEKMQEGRIPGLSLVIVYKNKAIYMKSYGYADINKKEYISNKTLFELGSTSKAFTGLGILLLKERGLLKLDDPITKYIPWFSASYNGKPVVLKIRHFINQTSGIPFKAIGYIPISSDNNALEETVRKVQDVKLDYLPGSEFQYSTVNYDVLGLIIEKITGKSYENFISSTILRPFKMDDTYVSRSNAYLDANMSKGYKLGFLKPILYNAPTYRGNTPAGYIITNVLDLTKWLIIQSGNVNTPFWKKLISESHTPDRTVNPGMYGLYYAVGWFADKSGADIILHGGSNPNFSSFLILNTKEQIAVGVMANLNTSYTETIGNDIFNIIRGTKYNEYQAPDQYKILDIACSIILIVSIICLIPIFISLFFIIVGITKKKRLFVGMRLKNIFLALLLIFTLIIIAGFLYIIPVLFLGGLPWGFVVVWAPLSFIPALIGIYILIFTICIYLQMLVSFPKKSFCNESKLTSMLRDK